MKILVGVDLAGHYKSTIQMVSRLGLSPISITLASSVDASVPLSTYGSESSPYIGEYIRIANESGRRVLDEAGDLARTYNIASESVLLEGNPAGSLMDHADNIGADLIAVESGQRSHVGSYSLGSVSRALAISSTKSLLITKGEVAPKGPLKVVFATDFSDYANCALDKFILMHSKGVESIEVVCAMHLSQLQQALLVETTFDPTIISNMQDKAVERMESAIQKLQAAGYKCSGEVKDVPVNEAIEQAMNSTKADLLVMGAQGHGFLHRVVLGSTSLHQVVAEPYSVLIIRPPTALNRRPA